MTILTIPKDIPKGSLIIHTLNTATGKAKEVQTTRLCLKEDF